MKIYLNLFLGAGIPFGIIMIVVFSFDNNVSNSIISGTFSGALFGGLMSLILGTLHNHSVKNTAMATGVGKLGNLYYMKTVKLDLPYDKAFDHCVDSVREIKKTENVNKSPETGKIKVKSGKSSWKSFGEKIDFKLKKLDDHTAEVSFSTKPLVKTNLADFGKNIENILRIDSFLNAFKTHE